MSSQYPYGYDPQQGQYPSGGEPAPLYPQQGQGYSSGAGYDPNSYPPPPAYPQQQGAYSQPLYPPPGAPMPGYGAPGMPSVPMPGYAMASVPMGVPMGVPMADPGGGQAVTGLVLGIIGLVFCWVGFFSFCAIIPLALNGMGIIFGALGRRSMQKRGLATAGLICGVIGLVLTVGFLVLYIAALAASSAQPTYSSY